MHYARAAMLKVTLGKQGSALRRILCLGAHSDDIEIGCGGTVLRLLKENRDAEVYWLVFSATQKRRREALTSARLFLEKAARKRVVVRAYRDGFFPYNGAKIKQEFERLKTSFAPDLILTHARHDLHQDHRLICELTWNTFRNHLILEYEVPKYDGDLGAPNFFVHLSEDDCRKKVEYLQRAFRSQAAKHWFTEDTFRGLMRLRGLESNSPSRFAEAFYCRKLALGS